VSDLNNRDRDRGKRPGGPPDGQRRDSGAPRDKRPSRDANAPAWKPREGAGGRPERSNSDRPGGDRRGSNPRDNKGAERKPWAEREPLDPAEQLRNELKSVRPRHDDPEIPEDVKPDELDRIARNELKTLSKDNAEGVAKHLVMAARMIEEDPDLAHRHAMSAARRAGRIAVVRETLAITAYATGDFALALRELRTFRRISGSNDQLALMVDSERGVGRPDRALELGRSVPRASLPVPVQVALAIAMSGARLDLEQTDEALLELEIPQLDASVAFSYSAELFAAYSAVLEDLGRTEESAKWAALAERAELAFEQTPDIEADDELIEVIEEESTESDDENEDENSDELEVELDEQTSTDEPLDEVPAREEDR
jgi:hypothetical protein